MIVIDSGRFSNDFSIGGVGHRRRVRGVQSVIVRKELLRSAIIGAASISALTTAANGQSTSDDRKPKMAYSIANVANIDGEGGSLFLRMKEAFAAASSNGDVAFAKYVAPGGELTLTSFIDSKLQKTPFTAKTVRATMQSCLGPYFVDEASTWVQLSWVCSTEANTPLSALLRFRNSPELSVTVWFENGLIKDLVALEPLPYPGARQVSMDAYAQLKGQVSPAPKPSLFGEADYPAEAVKNKWQGDVTVDLAIGADGTVKGCKIELSSGYAILDQATCDVLRQRAKFKPATDNEGKPVEDQFRQVIKWRL